MISSRVPLMEVSDEPSMVPDPLAYAMDERSVASASPERVAAMSPRPLNPASV